MHKRADVIRFAKMYGIAAKGDRQGLVMLSKQNKSGLWIDVFDGWNEAGEFLLKGKRDIEAGRAPRWDLPQGGTRPNPARRASPDITGAAKLAARFHGRAPDDSEIMEVPRPHIPGAMANIGQIYAIEYIAERDGKAYRFRHVFKARSRPQLAVSPDGDFVTMLGGAWQFTEDGFEDS